tara:strand:+ start:9201 stop:10043 length:843 start_codon:yes stop_codon:yes gene_type:complete
MKLKHNKKRNTAFLYESLIVELTKAIVSGAIVDRDRILETIRHYFKPSTMLWEDLQYYKALSESEGLDVYTAEKLIFEVKKDRKAMDHKQLFVEQSSLINRINRNLTKSVYSNFVPGYRSLATISQIFGTDLTTKQRVLLEKELTKLLTSPYEKKSNPARAMIPLDDLSYGVFVQKFNSEYDGSLLSEQKDLLNNYIMSVSDNGRMLRIYLNEELSRLKGVLTEATSQPDIKQDRGMTEATNSVIAIIESFKNEQTISEPMIKRVLKIQDLVREIESDGD